MMGVSLGGYAGQVIWIIVDSKSHPELCIASSSPWYTPIIVASVFWVIAILLEAAAFLFARHKATAGPIIGVIERKDR